MGRSHGFPDYSSQLTFEVLEIHVSSRSQIHVNSRFTRDGIHRNAAAKDAEVERAAWAVNIRSTKTVNHGRHCMHGIWSAKISPTVSPRPCHANAKSTASQRPMRDALKSGPVYSYKFAFAT